MLQILAFVCQPLKKSSFFIIYNTYIYIVFLKTFFLLTLLLCSPHTDDDIIDIRYEADFFDALEEAAISFDETDSIDRFDSSISSTNKNADKIVAVRQNFEESWLWLSADLSKHFRLVFQKGRKTYK